MFLFVAPRRRACSASEYYAANPLYPLGKTVGVINTDVLGVLGPGARFLASRGNRKFGSARHAGRTKRPSAGRRYSPDPRPEAGSFYRSDHFTFAKAGVPAIELRRRARIWSTAGVARGEAWRANYTAKRYHQPDDEYRRTWDFTGMVAGCRAAPRRRPAPRQQRGLAELERGQRVPLQARPSAAEPSRAAAGTESAGERVIRRGPVAAKVGADPGGRSRWPISHSTPTRCRAGRRSAGCWRRLASPTTREILDYATTMKAEPYLSINPMGKVPAIRHNGRVVTEVAAICCYLADAFPEANLAPPPGDRADYYRWIFFTSGPIEAAFSNKAAGWEPPPERQAMFGYGTYDTAIATLETDLGRARISSPATASPPPICSSARWSTSCSSSTCSTRARRSPIMPRG